MANIRIGVIDPSQAEKTNMEVPDDADVGALTEAMVETMGLPTTGANGRPMRYQLNLRADDGRLTRLNEGQSLQENGVQQDAVLQLTAEMVAGS